MQFQNEFEVSAPPADVMTLFDDLPLMASFVPGGELGEQLPDGSYPASLIVSFGPKKITFDGTVTAEMDRESRIGRVSGHAGADLRGAKMSVTVDYHVHETPRGSQVVMVSEAELTGMLREFARTGGVPIVEALLAEFVERLERHVSARRETSPADTSDACSRGDAPAALSASRFSWLMLKSMFRRVRKWMRR